MIRLAALVAAAFASLSAAHAAGIDVNGSVGADWGSPQLVSPSSDAILRPGHVVTVTLSGQVDINYETKSKRECSMFGLSCKRIHWTEHHWSGPGQSPVRVTVRLVGSGTVVASQVVGAGPATISVPFAGADFGARYELVASLEGLGASVDPGRSAGSYSVRLSIDAQPRASQFGPWLNSIKPTYASAISPEILDAPMVAGHGVQAARALRLYAASRYPVAQTENQAAHGFLLRKAVELGTEDADNALALADYFRATGQTAQADALITKVIGDLETKADSKSRVNLGKAYLALADASLRKGGGMRPDAVLNASGYLAKAVAAFRQGGRRDLLADAEVRRGHLLRGLRTQDSLAEAIAAYEAALALTPEMVRANLALEAPDAKSLKLLDWTQGYAPRPIAGEAETARFVGDAVPLLWDAARQRMLEATSDIAYQWRPGAAGEATDPAPALPARRLALAGNDGALLAISDSGSATYFPASGEKSDLRFGAAAQCLPPPPAPQAPLFPVAFASIAPDGDVIATYCNDSVHLFRIDPVTAKPVPAASVKFVPPGGTTPGNLAISAGPAACGVAVSMTAPPTAPGTYTTRSVTLVRLDGSTQPLALPPIEAGVTDWAVPVAAFTPDGRVLVVQPYAPLAAYRCDTGAAAPPVALPTATLLAYPKPPEPTPFALIEARWATKDLLAVSSPLSRELFLIDTKANKVSVTRGEDLAGFPFFKPTFSHNNMIVMVGGQPRAIQLLRRTQVRNLGDVALKKGPPSYLVGDPLSFNRLLTGGRYALSQSYLEGKTRVVDLSTGVSQPVPAWALDALPTGGTDGWAAARSVAVAGAPPPNVYQFMPPQDFVAVQTFKGPVPGAEVALPKLSDSERAVMIGEIKTLLAAAPMPPDPPIETVFPGSQLQGVVDDPSRLTSVMIRAGIFTGPLASGTGGVMLFCPLLAARTNAGNIRIIPIRNPVMKSVLVQFASGTPVITRTEEMDCNASFPVDGAKPAAVTRQFDNGGGSKIIWSRGGAPIDGGALASNKGVSMATTLADGSLLLLVEEQGEPTVHSLIRLLPSGGQVSACGACDKIALVDAAKVLYDLPQDLAAGAGQSGPRAIDTTGLIRVDPAGKVLALPDGEEMVIQSLVTGKDLVRFDLARIFALREDYAVVDAGDGRLEIHRFNPN